MSNLSSALARPAQAENSRRLKETVVRRHPDLIDKVVFCNAVAERPDIDGPAALMLFVMATKFHNSKTGRLDPCHKTLAKVTGRKRRATIATIGRLVEAGVLAQTARYDESGRTSNSYEFVGLDDHPAVIASRLEREEKARAKAEGKPAPSLRLVKEGAVDRATPVQSTASVSAVDRMGSVQRTARTPRAVDRTRTIESLNHEIEPEKVTLLSSFNARVDREVRKEGTGSSRIEIEIPTGLRDKEDREFAIMWDPIFRSIAEEFGFTGNDEIARVHGEFVDYYVDGNGKDVKSNNWERLIRSWCRKGAEIRKSKLSSSSASSNLPAELLDESHPNRADFLRTLEPLAKKHGLRPTEWNATLPRFKQMLGMPSSKYLTVLEAWAIHLEDEKRKGNIKSLPVRKVAL